MEMCKRLLNLAGCAALTLALSAAAFAQQTPAKPEQPTQTTVTTQTTQAIQNPDGTWTVIEYPAQKEVIVNFAPSENFSSAKGMAKVMRMADHTMIHLDLSGLPADLTGVNLYAVDPAGAVTLLGPVTLASGAAKQDFQTPLSKFMLVLSPEANLSKFGPETVVAFRSAVPEGFAVVPLASTDREDGAVVGERVAATSTAGGSTPFNAPMLGISGMKRGEDTKMKINFAGALTGARANVELLPRQDGPTQVKMRFHELKEAPAGKVYVVWAVSPDGKFVKLGQIVNTGTRNEAELRSETTLSEFGLLVTMEDEHSMPTGVVVGTVVP